MNRLTALAFVLTLAGCVPMASKLNSLSVGMTKADVIQTLGAPDSTSANGNVEYLTYSMAATFQDAGYSAHTPYFVRLVDGRVDAYGRTGDFGSTSP